MVFEVRSARIAKQEGWRGGKARKRRGGGGFQGHRACFHSTTMSTSPQDDPNPFNPITKTIFLMVFIFKRDLTND